MSQNLSSAACVIGALRVNHNISRLLKGEIGDLGVNYLPTDNLCKQFVPRAGPFKRQV